MKRTLVCLPAWVAFFLLAGPWQLTAHSQSSPTPSASPMIKTTTGPLGEYLTDAKGDSLYIFKADSSDMSTCTGQCAQVWPPFIMPSNQPPQTSGDAKSNLVGTIQRSDGTTQATYNHQPLYTYSVDKNPGQTNGQGVSSFGAQWYLVKPDGTPLTSASGPGTSATPSASPSSTGGSGY